MVTQGLNDAKVFMDIWEEFADNPSARRESTSELKIFMMHSGVLLWESLLDLIAICRDKRSY